MINFPEISFTNKLSIYKICCWKKKLKYCVKIIKFLPGKKIIYQNLILRLNS